MSKSFSVLIVEDHDPLRRILTELVQTRGWSPIATGRAQRAMEVARLRRPDFALLDLHVGGSSGLELFQALRREIGPVPSIMMSGEASSTETDAALDAGVFSFLRKPLAMPHLLRTLDLLVETYFPSAPDGAPRLPGQPQ